MKYYQDNKDKFKQLDNHLKIILLEIVFDQLDIQLTCDILSVIGVYNHTII